MIVQQIGYTITKIVCFYFCRKMVVFNNYEAIKEAVVTQKDKFVTVSEYLIEEPRPGQGKPCSLPQWSLTH